MLLKILIYIKHFFTLAFIYGLLERRAPSYLSWKKQRILTEAIALLEKSEIDCRIGPAVAADLMQNNTIRSNTTLQIIISQKDLEASAAVLITSDYRQISKTEQYVAYFSKYAVDISLCAFAKENDMMKSEIDFLHKDTLITRVPEVLFSNKKSLRSDNNFYPLPNNDLLFSLQSYDGDLISKSILRCLVTEQKLRFVLSNITVPGRLNLVEVLDRRGPQEVYPIPRETLIKQIDSELRI